MNDYPCISEECGKPYDPKHQAVASVLMKYNSLPLPPLSQLVSICVAVVPLYGYDTLIEEVTNTLVTTKLYERGERTAIGSPAHSFKRDIFTPLLEVGMFSSSEQLARLSLATKLFVNRALHVPVERIDIQVVYE